MFSLKQYQKYNKLKSDKNKYFLINIFKNYTLFLNFI